MKPEPAEVDLRINTQLVIEILCRFIRNEIQRAGFQRAVVGLKSRLVMQGESTAARAGALATDQSLLDRARSLDEAAAEIDAVTLKGLNAFLADHRPEALTTLTIGPTPLKGS